MRHDLARMRRLHLSRELLGNDDSGTNMSSKAPEERFEEGVNMGRLTN